MSETIDLCPDDALDETVQKIFSSFHPNQEFYWVARIFFSLDEKEFDFAYEVSDCINIFYDNLYDALVQFSSEEGVDFLSFVLPLSHTYKTHAYRAWPSLFEFKPKGPSGEVFYGILALIGKQDKDKSLSSSVMPFPTKRQLPVLNAVGKSIEGGE